MACASSCNEPSSFAVRTMAAASSRTFCRVSSSAGAGASVSSQARARARSLSEEAWTSSELNYIDLEGSLAWQPSPVPVDNGRHSSGCRFATSSEDHSGQPIIQCLVPDISKKLPISSHANSSAPAGVKVTNVPDSCIGFKAASHGFQCLVNGTATPLSCQFGTMFTEPLTPHSLQTRREPIFDQGKSWGRVSSRTSTMRRSQLLPCAKRHCHRPGVRQLAGGGDLEFGQGLSRLRLASIWAYQAAGALVPARALRRV